MTSSLWNRKVVEAGLVILFGALFLWWNPNQYVTPVRSVLWIAVEPLAIFFQHVHSGTTDMMKSLVRIGSLRRENVSLSAENIQLRSRVAELEDMEKENEQLRTEIGAQRRRSDYAITALVVGYDSRGMGDWLMLNKGKKDGIVSGMTVISGENVLVGTVEEVLESMARVRLITHPNMVFNVHTVETQAKGVVRGKFGLGILLDSVLQTESIREGDRVVTSEWGEQYPPGLFVGIIGGVGVSSDGLFQQATVIPPMSFFDMRSVSLIR